MHICRPNPGHTWPHLEVTYCRRKGQKRWLKRPIKKATDLPIQQWHCIVIIKSTNLFTQHVNFCRYFPLSLSLSYLRPFLPAHLFCSTCNGHGTIVTFTLYRWNEGRKDELSTERRGPALDTKRRLTGCRSLAYVLQSPLRPHSVPVCVSVCVERTCRVKNVLSIKHWLSVKLTLTKNWPLSAEEKVKWRERESEKIVWPVIGLELGVKSSGSKAD